MTTTPNDPTEVPEADSAGDPTVGPGEETGSPAEPNDFPETDPEDAQPGQMPESTDPIINA